MKVHELVQKLGILFFWYNFAGVYIMNLTVIFQLWSIWHYLMIIQPYVLAAALIFFTHKAQSKTKYKIGFGLSILAVIILLLRNIEVFVTHGYKIVPDIIPLQMCHLANFIMLFAYWKRSKVLFAFAFSINLPAATLSLIFASYLADPFYYPNTISFMGLAYVYGHALIIIVPAFALFSGEFAITKKVFMQNAVLVIGLYLVMNVVTNIMNNAWHYTVDHPDFANYFHAYYHNNGMPLNLMWDIGKEYILPGNYHINPVYLLLTIVLGSVVIFALYWLAKLLTKVFHIVPLEAEKEHVYIKNEPALVNNH